MAYLTRLLGAVHLLNESSAIYRGRAGNLTRLLGASRYRLFPRYGLTARIVEGHLGRAMMSTVGGSVSVPTSSSSLRLRSLDDYVGKPAEGSQNIPYEGSSDSIYFSVDDLDSHVQDLDLDEDLLMEVLPVMRRTVHNGQDQWSLLQRYCCSKDTIVDIKVALEKELAAICVFLLFIDVPTHIKEGVAWAMKDICSRTSEAATNMHIDEERVTLHAPTKMSSFDQESVNALLVNVLCSKNEEVLRQVCCSLGFVAKCRRSYQSVSFGNGIQNKLIQLSRECDSPVLAHILFAINGICMINKGMREKIIEAEFSDGFLRRILRRDGRRLDCFLEAEAYYMVYTIVKGQCNDELWKYLKEHLMPAVVDRCYFRDIDVMRAGACVISKFITKASSRCIKELVDLGCLKSLIGLLSNDDVTIKSYCFEAVDAILSLGDADPSKNEYAKMIDDLTKEWGHTIIEWEVFFVNYISTYADLADEGSGIVKRYRPDKYPEWLEWQERMGGRPS